MGQYGYDFTGAQTASQVEDALASAYGSKISLGSIVGANTGSEASSGFSFDINDPTLAIGDIDTFVTNLTGQYSKSYNFGTGTGTGVAGATNATPASGLDLGSFLNSIGAAIRAFLASLKLPSFSWIWWVVAAIILLFFIGAFGKGLGQGVAAKV
jgi:hypothetical protein